MFASVYLYLSWLSVLHCKCCKNSLRAPKWKSISWWPLLSSPYVSKCERGGAETDSKNTLDPLREGPASTYSDILFIKSALEKYAKYVSFVSNHATWIPRSLQSFVRDTGVKPDPKSGSGGIKQKPTQSLIVGFILLPVEKQIRVQHI